ncbi:MAG: hypothetical protein JWR88_1212 [Pseudonocardia sp.]|nr:hypothetical protein [Pseudonocardia sp.]
MSITDLKAAYANSRPPAEVHRAFQFFLAVGALGVVQEIVTLIFYGVIFGSAGLGFGYGVGSAIVGLIIYLIILAVLFWIALQMRAGRNWARITLTVLGGIGALFFVIGLIASLTGFGGLVSSVLGGGYSVYLIISLLIDAASAALIGYAIYLMFRPNVNSYFR